MLLYIVGGVAVFVGSGVMAMAGLGAAFLFVPLFYYLGVPLGEATSTALLLNAVSLSAATVTYARARLIDWRAGIPVLVAAVVLAPLGASLTVVSVVPTHPGRAPIDPWDDTEVHTKELLEAGRLLREEGIEARLVETAGDVPDRIEQIAADGGYDAVIVGSRGMSMLGRALQGSVSEHVAANAETTVIVAR